MQQLLRVVCKLLPYAQRQYHQGFPALMLSDNTAIFKLLDCFAKPKSFKQRPSPAAYRPLHRIPLMRFQYGINLRWIYLKPALRGKLHLGA